MADSYHILLTEHLLIRQTTSVIIFKIGRNMNDVVNLSETQRTSKLRINSQNINVNDIVLVMIKWCPDTFGELP